MGCCAARCFATTNNLGDESGIPVELNGDEDYANVCRSSPMVTNPPQSISYLPAAGRPWLQNEGSTRCLLVMLFRLWCRNNLTPKFTCRGTEFSSVRRVKRCAACWRTDAIATDHEGAAYACQVSQATPRSRRPQATNPSLFNSSIMLRRTSVLFLVLPLAAKAFVAPSGRAVAAGDCQSACSSQTQTVLLQQRHQAPPSWSTAIYSSNGDDDAAPTSRRRRKAAGLDPEMRSKLLSESIAPWRTVRLFLYVAAGSGALLGGLITLSAVAAALSGARTDVDLNTEVRDLVRFWEC